MSAIGRRRVLALSLVLTGGLAGCVTRAQRRPPWTDPRWPGDTDLLLLGEQHDAAAHQALAAEIVGALADRDRLQALVVEMAEQGRSSAGLARDADEAAVRAALAWDDRGWPWSRYGPIVLRALRAGVPVHGGNLPRAALRATMADAALDASVDADWHRTLADDVRDGHCGLLPAAQLPGMTRVQIARDRAMAETLAAAAGAGRVVVMVAGANHVDATRGVPRHLQAIAPGLRLRTLRFGAGAAPGDTTPGFDETWPTPEVARDDPCIGLAERFPPQR